MTLIDQIHRLERIHHLIRRKATGSPGEFSEKLGISDRQMYRLIDELKSYGLPIEYSRLRRTYYYCREVEVEILFEIREPGKGKIFGGIALSARIENDLEFTDRKWRWKMVPL